MKSQIQTAFRSISQNRLCSFLNILGLSIALTSTLYIFLWVYSESGYDKFNKNFHRIYQINSVSKDGFRFGGCPPNLATSIADNSPGIESAVRIRKLESVALSYAENKFMETKGITSDPEIFDIFSFIPVIGKVKEALGDKNSMVITQSFAKRYFGDENPLGKQLILEGEKHLTVQAVIEDVPVQSHLQFDFILPFEFSIGYVNWANPPVTYILLHKNANPKEALNTITQIAINQKMQFISDGRNSFVLRPLKDIYLDNGLANSLGNTGDKRNIIIFSLVGLLILVLACINYINISVSVIAKRIKSSSVKKICGATRKTIFREQIFESSLLIFVSLLISLLLLFLLKQYFISFIGENVLTFLNVPVFFLFIITIFISVVTLSGIYPAVVLAQSDNLKLFKNPRTTQTKNKKLQIMVGIQNVISIILIICALGFYKQMNFVQHKKLGFTTNQILHLQLRGNTNTKIEAIKNDLSANPNVLQVALKDCLPFDTRKNTRNVLWRDNGELKNSDNSFGLEESKVDEYFFKLMEVELAEGRLFDASLSTDKQSYILNKEAVRQMRLDNPIGQEFSLNGQWGKIIGVIEDTYFKTLHTKIKPQVFHLYYDIEKESTYSVLFIKLTGSNVSGTIAQIEKIWNKFGEGMPFEFSFLDKEYEMLYKYDLQITKLISLFTLLAVFIACLGLFGQSTFTAENRIKEIGIRKVNGAKSTEILTMINTDFFKWIAIAFIIATPIAWYAMHCWLENFAYKTELSWWIFALAGLMALGIALLTVSWQSWKAATRNPVEALRYE